MFAEIDAVNVTVFDYIYTLGSKHPTPYFQWVVILEPDDQNFPAFSLRPEGVFDKMFSAFGYQDIDFSQRSEFSRQYTLRGEDKSVIRRIFNDRVLSFYEGNPTLSQLLETIGFLLSRPPATAAGGNRVVCWAGAGNTNLNAAIVWVSKYYVLVVV